MEETCSICLEPTSRRDVILSACKHMFHEDCISRLFNDTCPVCRCPISPGDIDGDALGVIKKRKKDEKASEVERDLIVLQTVENIPSLEFNGLPGSIRFYAILFTLMKYVPFAYLISFQNSEKFATHYHDKLHHDLDAFLNIPCSILHRSLFYIHRFIFGEKRPLININPLSNEYIESMKFMLPRSRICITTCMNMFKSKYPDISKEKMYDYYNAATYIAIGTELCLIMGPRIQHNIK